MVEYLYLDFNPAFGGNVDTALRGKGFASPNLFAMYEERKRLPEGIHLVDTISHGRYIYDYNGKIHLDIASNHKLNVLFDSRHYEDELTKVQEDGGKIYPTSSQIDEWIYTQLLREKFPNINNADDAINKFLSQQLDLLQKELSDLFIVRARLPY